jgi:hypothetical protein
MRFWLLMLMLMAGSAAAQTIETYIGPNGERCTRSTDMHGQTREECEKKPAPASANDPAAPKPTPTPLSPPTTPTPSK